MHFAREVAGFTSKRLQLARESFLVLQLTSSLSVCLNILTVSTASIDSNLWHTSNPTLFGKPTTHSFVRLPNGLSDVCLGSFVMKQSRCPKGYHHITLSPDMSHLMQFWKLSRTGLVRTWMDTYQRMTRIFRPAKGDILPEYQGRICQSELYWNRCRQYWNR